MLQEEKWKRKVDALDTAVEVYIEKGYLHNDKNYFVRGGTDLCIYDYISADDPEPEDEEQWEQEAVFPIKITFDLTKKESECFNLTDHGGIFEIKNSDIFYLRFDGEHKMWYTMNDPDDVS